MSDPGLFHMIANVLPHVVTGVVDWHFLVLLAIEVYVSNVGRRGSFIVLGTFAGRTSCLSGCSICLREFCTWPFCRLLNLFRRVLAIEKHEMHSHVTNHLHLQTAKSPKYWHRVLAARNYSLLLLGAWFLLKSFCQFAVLSR